MGQEGGIMEREEEVLRAEEGLGSNGNGRDGFGKSS